MNLGILRATFPPHCYDFLIHAHLTSVYEHISNLPHTLWQIHHRPSYLEPLDGLLAGRAEDAVVEVGDGPGATGQGRERGRGTHSCHGIGHCGEITPLIDSLAIVHKILVIAQVCQRERRRMGSEQRKEGRKEGQTDGRKVGSRCRVVKERHRGLRGTRGETDKKEEEKKQGNNGEEYKKKRRESSNNGSKKQRSFALPKPSQTETKEQLKLRESTECQILLWHWKIHADDKLASMRMFRERKSTIYPSLQCMMVKYSLVCCLFVSCVACPVVFQPLSIWLIASISSTHREPKWRPPSQSFLPWSLIGWLWLCLLRILNEPQDQPIQIFFLC